MSVKPGDLNGEQRKAFETWRSLGLSESAAMDCLITDGVVAVSEEEQLARSLSSTFGLSEAAAEAAARGRDGGPPSSRPVSESQPARQAEDRRRLMAVIEAWAADLREDGPLGIERGESKELASLRAAYGKALGAARNHAEAAWIIGVVESWRPELLKHPGSSGGSKTQTRKVGETRR
jgi:hypothetical protein